LPICSMPLLRTSRMLTWFKPMRVLVFLFVIMLESPFSPAFAWWDEGHMQIAYLAYQRLDPAVRDRADALLKLNPDYKAWTSNAPEGKEKLYAFVHAATWADDIKTKADYYDDKVTDSTAGQIVPFGHLKHGYWHFKDTLYTPDGTTLPAPDLVDAVTQLKLMIAKLPSSSEASDNLRSYDLTWMLHLAGDLHQPLHAIARYSAQISDGDRGGNAEMVIPATGETIALHAYWDRIFGGYSSVFGAMFDADEKGGLASVAPDAAKALILDPDIWAQESFELAKQKAYAAPIRSDKTAVPLTSDYEANARNVARNQAALAAARLANLLNLLLK
jgi:S1/P1 Nuclease